MFMELLTDPKSWILVAFVCFFALFGAKIFKALTGALDKRSGTIRTELDEARRLREEAEAVLAAYRRKYDESLKEADEILAKARKDAEAMLTRADIELKGMLAARIRQSQDKIAQAEKRAIQEVQNHVVDITVAAAKTMIADRLQKSASDELIKMAIADVEQKVH
jgi:F-type H+-transporting ATPase subunit b